jgi:DNA-binding CsgD family transcriptional regulator
LAELVARLPAFPPATLLHRHLAQHGDGVLAVPVVVLLAEVEVAAGRIKEARAIGVRLLEMAKPTPTPLLRGCAQFVAGLARDGPHAMGHLEAALAAFGAAGLPFEEARARLELARRLSAAKPDVAIAEARAAVTVFDRLGAVSEADAATALLRSLGARGRTGPKNIGLLSKREQEVLQLIGIGLSNPEIAARLFISRKTASHHVSNILAKLSLRNRAEAAVFTRSSMHR